MAIAAWCCGNDVDNDATLELLAREALSHARAGADMVAPSDMMDGRVGAIRTALDENGFMHMSRSWRTRPSSRRPFTGRSARPPSRRRNSAIAAPTRWTRPTATRRCARVALDLDEGADIVMVKPALPYLDLIYRVKQEFNVPVAAYNVSGEYSMIRAAGINGWIDEERAMMEVLTSIKRAGADMILTLLRHRGRKTAQVIAPATPRLTITLLSACGRDAQG